MSVWSGWGDFWTADLLDCKKQKIYKKYLKGGKRLMKGYFVHDGYMGYVDGEYRLFADETDYREYVQE